MNLQEDINLPFMKMIAVSSDIFALFLFNKIEHIITSELRITKELERDEQILALEVLPHLHSGFPKG